MKKTLSFLISFCSIVLIFGFVSDHAKKPDICVSAEEVKLFNLINTHRKNNGLSAIPLSSSLTQVAQAHSYDLSYNRPFNQNCNMHSWSKRGKWRGCCYTSDHSKASCMWSKPKEIAGYTGNGYEIAHGYSQNAAYMGDSVSAETALEGWKLSDGHHHVILNQKTWAKVTWNAIGVGINRDFACVWFGTKEDGSDTPKLCK